MFCQDSDSLAVRAAAVQVSMQAVMTVVERVMHVWMGCMPVANCTDLWSTMLLKSRSIIRRLSVISDAFGIATTGLCLVDVLSTELKQCS
jgi:hypothetical protein